MAPQLEFEFEQCDVIAVWRVALAQHRCLSVFCVMVSALMSRGDLVVVGHYGEVVSPTDDVLGTAEAEPSIEITENGPIRVLGSVRILRRREVRDDSGAAVAWQDTQELEMDGEVWLCRCGNSQDKPFCDGSHKKGFEAIDVCPPQYDERAKKLGGVGLTISDDRKRCVHAEMCFSKTANVWKQVGDTADEGIRTTLVSMVERCPSGALTVRFDNDEQDFEGDTTATIAVIDDGPLWVIGSIPVTLADGSKIERRNRLALCRCGQSETKPLCDGGHHKAGFTDAAQA